MSLIKVLVVDDHGMVAETLVRALNAEDGMVVVGVAANATEALDAARRHLPDVVVMDFYLSGGINGAEATRLLRSERPEMNVVMLTGASDESIMLEAIEAGCCGFVTKGNAVNELVGAVNAAYAGESVISPAMLVRLLPKIRSRPQGTASKLTHREMEVLGLLAEGHANTIIAERLFVSLHTVRNHVQNIITKLGAHSKLEAVALAAREGLVHRQ